MENPNPMAQDGQDLYQPLMPVYGRPMVANDALPLSEAILPEKPVPADSAYQIIRNELLMDAKPGLNLATFCNEAYTDPFGMQVVMNSIKKNFIDHTEYPGTNITEKRSIRMIARELGTEFAEDDPKTPADESEQGLYGTATIGSSEAVMLGLIAHRFIWNMKHRTLLDNMDTLKIRVDPRDQPVVLMSSQVHGCWDKYCRYYNVVPLYIPVHNPPYAIHDPNVVYDILNTRIDDTTSRYRQFAAEIRNQMGYTEPQGDRVIGELVMAVGTCVGTTFTGNYDDVKGIDDAVEKWNVEMNSQYSQEQHEAFPPLYTATYKKLETTRGENPRTLVPTRIPDLVDVPIHVDAASGFSILFSSSGENVPFTFTQCPKRVLSINMSNHKFGMTFPGMGCVIFKNNTVVDQSLIYHIAYLGGSFDDYTVNFSRGSSMIVMQYYNLLRFGREGYRGIMDNCVSNTRWFTEQVYKHPKLGKYFRNVSNYTISSPPTNEVDTLYFPIIAFTWKDEEVAKETSWTLTDLSDQLLQAGWTVPAYNIPVYTPEDTQGIPVLRVVVQQVVTQAKLHNLINSMEDAVNELEENAKANAGAMVKKVHAKKRARHTKALC